MAPNAVGNTTRPGLRNQRELNVQVGSQCDQNEYVSLAYDEYGGMPPPINPSHLVRPLQQFAGGSRPPKSEGPHQALAWLPQDFLRLKQPSCLPC